MGLLKKWIIKKYLEQPGNLAYYDQLCGCHNRNFFELVIKENEKLWSGKTITIIDINSFKKLNDVYGHRAGDAALKNVVDTISNRFHYTHDEIVRYGGDEFIVLSSDIDFDKINEILEEQYNISISYGSVEREGYQNLDTLIDRADKLMYKMKQGYYRGDK